MELNVKNLLGLFMVLCLSCTAVLAQGTMEQPDSWNGKLAVGQSELTIVFNFFKDENGVRKCTMDSPDQGAKGIPGNVIVLSADSMKVNVPSIGASYSGKISGRKVFGTFVQNGYSFPLALDYGPFVANRPQTPKGPFSYYTEEVVFTAHDGAKLAGTLSVPLYASAKTPVVLMVTGSGLQDRDETMFDHKPFHVIADFLARSGIASLRYDDRGAGESERGNVSITMQSNSADAAAGLEYLASLHRFGRIGLLGHSEGGRIAMMLAAEGRPDFIVSLAGPGVDGKRILLEQSRAGLEGMGMPEIAVTDYCRVMELLMDMKIKGETAVDADKLISDAGAANFPPSLKQNIQALDSVLDDSWMRSFLNDDPAGDLQRIVCPVMAIFGEKDIQVPAGMNMEALKAYLPESSANLLKTYPELNHLFQHCRTGLPQEYNSIEETISPEVLADIVNWISGK